MCFFTNLSAFSIVFINVFAPVIIQSIHASELLNSTAQCFIVFLRSCAVAVIIYGSFRCDTDISGRFHRIILNIRRERVKLLMETFKGTLFRQTMFAEFERDMHAMCEAGTPLTADLISNHYYGLVKRYFGPDVVCDKQIAYEWARIPHFYSCFYVYKYATCISAASAIVKRIETEGKDYIDQYINFLKCGDSKSPLESLLVAGIDMSKPEVVRSAIEDFADTVKQFRELYNRQK